MNVVGLRPITLKDAVLTIAEDDYTASVGQVLFVPQVRWSWSEELCQTSPTPVWEGTSWTCTVSYAQDFTTPEALAIYLVEHAAQTRTITFVPTRESDMMAVQADVMILPGQMGGVPNQTLSATVTLPCFEEPRLGKWQELGGEHAVGW